MVTRSLSLILCSAFAVGCLVGCGDTKQALPTALPTAQPSSIRHAMGFSVQQQGDITVIAVTAPWPGAAKQFTYALVPKEKLATVILDRNAYDAIVPTPVEKLVVTSTTHIPALEALGVLEAVVGFPDTDLISSPAARKQIATGAIQELGSHENLNTELLLALQPEVVVGFGVTAAPSAYTILQQAGIPVVYHGDWMEQTPLGKAEWIAFFAPFFHKQATAERTFTAIEAAYQEAKCLAQQAAHRPTVLTGGLYKGVWYAAGGTSWMAQFLDDAHAQYLWAHTEAKGSLALSLEAVLEKAQQAEVWLNPSAHSSYRQLQQANAHYTQFAAFARKQVYSSALKKGTRGGVLFYELAPHRPDLVLKDLIAILHPELLPSYSPHFFMPLP